MKLISKQSLYQSLQNLDKLCSKEQLMVALFRNKQPTVCYEVESVCVNGNAIQFNIYEDEDGDDDASENIEEIN